MAAQSVDVRALLIFILMNFFVRKPSFTSADTICLAINATEVIESKETFIYASLWQYNQEKTITFTGKYFTKLLLLLAGDLEINPGPVNRKLTCTTCVKTIRKNQKSEVCRNCNEKFHMKCMHDVLENNTEVFYCQVCYVNDQHEQSNFLNPELSEFIRKRGLKIFHQNLNGIIGKLNKVKLLLNNSKKCIHFLGVTETHTDKSVKDSQLNIPGYVMERKDRKVGPHGGVLCYIRDDLKYDRRYDLESKV